MDPSQRKLKLEPSASAMNHRLGHQSPPIDHHITDPDVPPPSSIQNISHRFSKLYANHKKLICHSSKACSHPQPDLHLPIHRKDVAFPPVSDSRRTILTKSTSQKERNSRFNFNSAVSKILSGNEKDERNYTKPSRDPTKDTSLVQPSELFLKRVEKVNEVMGRSSGSCIPPSVNGGRSSSLCNSHVEPEEVMKRVEGVKEGNGRSSGSCIPPAVNGGRSRPLCNAQVELADFLSSSGAKVVAVDMPPFMQIHAVDCARKARDSLEKFTAKTLAFTLKKEFDGVYGPAWQCIVGTGFGSFVTHSVGGFMYFSMDHKLYILLFKTNVKRAEQ